MEIIIFPLSKWLLLTTTLKKGDRPCLLLTTYDGRETVFNTLFYSFYAESDSVKNLYHAVEIQGRAEAVAKRHRRRPQGAQN